LSLDLRPRGGVKIFFFLLQIVYIQILYRSIYMGGAAALGWAGLDWAGRSGWDALSWLATMQNFMGWYSKEKKKNSILVGIYK
jgi:hypothetical protein